VSASLPIFDISRTTYIRGAIGKNIELLVRKKNDFFTD
jgi:hypothetical protein